MMHMFVLNSVGTFVLLLGKLGIVALTCTAAVFWLQVSDVLLSLLSPCYHHLVLFPWMQTQTAQTHHQQFSRVDYCNSVLAGISRNLICSDECLCTPSVFIAEIRPYHAITPQHMLADGSGGDSVLVWHADLSLPVQYCTIIPRRVISAVC